MEEQKLDECSKKSGSEISNRAGDLERVILQDRNETVSRKSKQEARKKRNSQNRPALSQDVNADADFARPPAKKKQSKGVKTSVQKGKTSVAPGIQEHVAEGTEHIFRTHICTECRRCFKTRSHLKEHMRLHFPDPSLQCPTCKNFFTSKSKLRIHMLRESGEKLHRCHLCEYGTVERNTLRRHITSVHGHQEETEDPSELFTCPTCQTSFGQSQALKLHMKSHQISHQGQPLPCLHQGCSFQSSDKKLLQKHLLDEHGVEAVECTHHACCALFRSKDDMEAHFRTHQAFHCTQCDFSCSNKSRFQQHRRQGHAGETQLRCSFCSFTSFNPVEFEQHVGHLHANEKTHKCQECSFVTAHKRVLKRHMLMHTGEKPHKCALCEFRCRDETYLSKHMLTHSDDKQHMCSECGYVTKWKHYLNVHMRKHTGDLRYKCNQCMYRCHRIDQLNSHKLRHQANSLICEVCAYTCKRKTELLKHMQLKHSSGENHQPRVYRCKFCSYSTKYRQALHNHENCKHTQTKEFRCALCSYTTFSNTGLFLHKRKVHGYVPGDAKWLEMYAEKERRNNSVDEMQSFYSNVSEREVGSGSDSKNKQVVSESIGLQTLKSCEIANDETSEPQGSSDANVSEKETTKVIKDQEQRGLLTPSSNADEENPETSHCETENQGVMPSSEPTGDSPSSCPLSDDPQFPNGSVSDEEEDELVPNCEESSAIEDQIPDRANETSATEAAGLETQLQVMRRQDKDQAEALILEGRVQMLVVQTEQNVYRCDHCSYVTHRQAALLLHCRSSCRVTKAALRCQDCGLCFKQRRSLNTHRLRKCPAVQKKNRKTCAGNALRDIVIDQSQEEAQRNGHDRVTDSEENVTQSASIDYSDYDGKFRCNSCSFSCTRKATIARHCAQCTESTSKRNLAVNKDAANPENKPSQMDGEPERREEDGNCEEDLERKKTLKRFSCPKCPFVCQQKRALTSHEKRGCLKPGEIQCQHCSYVTKSEKSLNHHVLIHGKNKGVKRGKQAELCCKLCPFTCKQERRMNQHVALKHEGIRPFCCRFCGFTTARRHRLDAHESLHTGIGRHRCELCDQTFGTSSKLRLHRQRIHDRKPTHFCSLCDYKGYNPTDISRHVVSCHTGDLSHPCSRCDASFSSDVALKQHFKRTHQTSSKHRCSQCSFTCSTQAVLKAHLHSEHSQNTNVTSQETPDRSKVFRVHRCPDCAFTTAKKLTLIQHIMDEHENGPDEEKTLKCDICSFACVHQLVFDQHVRSHGGTCHYKCTECDFSTRNKLKITWHIRIHTGEKPYRCDKCDYTCADPSRLKYHMRIHQDERKYLCPECGYKCKWINQLKYHMTKHSGAKPYACAECEYRTNRADALRIHCVTRHRDTRPFICEKCGKAFKTRFLLRTHQKRHSDDRPYVCSQCHRGFRWPAGLRHHYLSHTSQLPFSCRHCNYRAKQRFQVVKHLHKHHPDKSTQGGVVKDPNVQAVSLQKGQHGPKQDVDMDTHGEEKTTEQ
ncbi:zinc finger protein 142 [Trichomycterus rosablanca]|uniref:zinc finger protein 142 n=1 Tax=Trichomycterus rosablanca TaxID=2290929 RepID=UPI002F355D85